LFTITGTGTPVDQVRGILAAGRDAILTIDPQGARSVRALVPDALLIFIMPPSIEDLDQRLAHRGSEDGDERAKRRHNAEAEMAARATMTTPSSTRPITPTTPVEQIWEIIQAEARRDPPRRVQV
jgi:guanylate kinase